MKSVIGIIAVELACILGGGPLDLAHASQMADRDQEPEEFVAEMVRSHDVVLDGTVLEVDSYDSEPPPFDNFPRRGCSVLHVRVREYLRGSGPDTVRLVFGAVESPGGVNVSSAYGVFHVPRVGERAVFWLAWWEQGTAEVFSAGQVWMHTAAGEFFVPSHPRGSELFVPAERSQLAGVPAKKIIAMIRKEARSLMSCYRLIHSQHSERLQRLPETECNQ